MRAFILIVMVLLLAGCVASRSMCVQVPVSGAETFTTAEIEEKATTPWSVGDLTLTAFTVRAADGATTSSATITATKDSAVGMWTTIFTYAAGIITALAAAGL